MDRSGISEAVQPFAWLAAIAFLVGVFCYLALGRPSQAVAGEELAPPAASSLVSGPASAEWNLPKHI